MKEREEFYEAQRKFRSELCRFIKDFLNKRGGRYYFSEDPWGYSVYISYDGGNHPEYASNCFSEVYGIFLHDERICFETEDTECYPEDYVPTIELDGVAEVLEEIETLEEN